MLFKRTLEDRVKKAKKDDKELNKLIEEYKPFIASTVQKKIGRFVKYGQDDELTIGMLAFKEAIESYDKNKGKFLSFAKRVINLRLIDYYRKHVNENNEVYMSQIIQENDDNVYELGASKAIIKHQDKEENEVRKIEILEFKKELDKWGIKFTDLVKSSPKQKRVRDLYKNVAKSIVENEYILNKLLEKKKLPIKEIQNIMSIHRKKLERGRIYIIALVIVLTGDYEYIREYIDWR
ncbi:RNA polymerase sigma-I factor [Caldisalinibacter kiritimatiensis]|uniref:RNA polymerase sigma factor SigI n=1 Tax=Caldisalinibacter kiritimatiensis TaxID=1304284 RepID=R1ASW8_9FIRM|nr:RNA polymerase sigma-I factor [Caldisalinibacter kiritimatiensis]EOC99751.1 RNA polymerase sigma-54 factor RpoN [Caldisalinibacter kiritimatiensis]